MGNPLNIIRGYHYAFNMQINAVMNEFSAWGWFT